MRTAFLLLCLIGSSAFGVTRPANDNPLAFKKCDLLLIEKNSSLILKVSDAAAIFISGRKHVRAAFQPVLFHWAELHDNVNFRKEMNRAQKSEDALSAIALAPDGTWIESDRSSDMTITLTLRSGVDFRFLRQVQVRARGWLGLLGALSPEHGFVVARNFAETKINVISTYTGDSVFERESLSDEPIHVAFSSERMMNVRQGALVENFRLNERGVESEKLTRKAFHISSRFENNGGARVPRIASRKCMFLVRYQKGDEGWMGYIDVYENQTNKLVRTIPIPALPVTMALSPSERVLAVSSQQAGVRLYDLRKPSFKPAVVIDFDNSDGKLLAFVDERSLLVGSIDIAEIYRFELPKLID